MEARRRRRRRRAWRWRRSRSGRDLLDSARWGPRFELWRGCRPRLRAADAAMGGGAEEEAHGRQHERQPGRLVSADRPDAVPQPPAATSDRANEEPDADHLRVELRAPLHLYGWPAGAEQRS